MSDKHYYVTDNRDRRPFVGQPSVRFPVSTLDECERAISYYRDMDYPDFPYSIVDFQTGKAVRVCHRDDAELTPEDIANFERLIAHFGPNLEHADNPAPIKLAPTRLEWDLAVALGERTDALKAALAQLARYDAIIDAHKHPPSLSKAARYDDALMTYGAYRLAEKLRKARGLSE